MTEKDWLQLYDKLSRERVEDKDVKRLSTPFQYKAKKSQETVFLERAMIACPDADSDARPYTKNDISAIERELGTHLDSYWRMHLSGIAQRYFLNKAMTDKKSMVYGTRKKELNKMKEACEIVLDKIDNPNPLFMVEFPFFARLRKDLERMHAVVCCSLQFGPVEQKSTRGRTREAARTFFIQELASCYQAITGEKTKNPYRSLSDGPYEGEFFRFVDMCLYPLEEKGNRSENTVLGRAIQEVLAPSKKSR